ncbi:NAD(P)/FAD-dependent oxidoreductase [Clostridium butyricum]|uniref:NAD(P)/FAD-dependent oxidoreductase n=1 Tax=Clostridium butyricum TaxID=1492 RepID=UPI0002CB327E|nr:NAD(P)/FAD-dependent oxidoreductase [Clostridium butyricum]EMU53398.1 FAD-dependent pyridine nucleotide-disulfide oxidoreductase [Clostridium butyricum DKU-01]
MPSYDLIIIGAGIAGMTAALGAARQGIGKILVIEKESSVGGIINQCIHNGFGKKLIGEYVTGPEYIQYIKDEIQKENIEIILNSNVLDINRDRVVTYVSPSEGVKEVNAKAIIFAMGAREKYSGNIMISTNTLTGIFTVGEAQRIVNLDGYIPGKNAIITAKDRWGFLLARRLLIEGGSVSAVVLEDSFKNVESKEINDIIDGFGISIIEKSRIIGIEGNTRINSVKLLNLEDGSIINKECDCLLLSVGFIPETVRIKKLNIEIDERTLGPKVNDYMTSTDGFFACGNIVYGEDVLKISEIDGIECGEKAASYIKKYFS